MKLNEKPKKPDQNYEKDRMHYCLGGKEFRENLFEVRRGIEQMAELGKELKEKEDNKPIYDAIKLIKKPKIAELAAMLKPVIEESGYIEFSLDKPEIAREVTIGFNCLDAQADRSDYDSRLTLQKIIKATLNKTNWRLMSDGISIRLGYLSGKLKAYEGEEALKKLIANN
jgi:hypothetical protein